MKKPVQTNKPHKHTFSHTIHHGEVLPGSKVKNDAPTAYGQKLAADKGTSGAMKSLLGRYRKLA